MSFRHGLIGLLATGVLGMGLLWSGCGNPNSSATAERDSLVHADSLSETPVFDIRSVTLDARRKPDSSLLVRLRDLGITHLTLVPFGWQSSIDEPTIRVDTTDGWYSESHTGIRALARQAEALGMGIILKPHIWVGGHDEGQNRSQIGFDTEAHWQEWEAQYRAFVMHYARLAAEVDADVVVLGTELQRPATRRPTFWRTLAEEVRQVYEGQLTYAANWHEEFEDIAFWDALDYVGVQAYFPLAEGDPPTLSTLRAQWQTHRARLARIHKRTDRPVLFTEIGYRSAPSTAAAPWRWPEDEAPSASADSALQARCYRAFLSTVGQAPWLAGAIIWKWHPEPESDRPMGFTPQGKPAEQVLHRWFSGRSASPSPEE